MVLNVTPLTIGFRLLTSAVKCTDWSKAGIPANYYPCGTDAMGVMLLAYAKFCFPDMNADDQVMAVTQHAVNGTSPSTAAT